MNAHPVFTPSAMDAEDLDALTVGRTSLFDTLVNRVRAAARDGSRPHTLLVAPRGGGKTHTLHIALNRALSDPRTAESTLPVLIPEDSLAIGSYADLLVEMARAIDPELAETARELRRHKDPVGIEAAILAAADGRMVLLAVENLDRVFDGIGTAGQGSLRAWVETSTAVLVLATSPALFAGVSSRSYPWYGSFIVETLPELTVDDGAELLIRAAHRRGDADLAAFIESGQGRERLSAIHRLAGGSPRLWHILSDCIDVPALDALVPAVETLLDRLAPYYQQQLWQLPAGEQRLVVELARGWEPRTVGDLAGAVGVSNQSAATALGRLTAARWVKSAKATDGDKRASWYDIAEPLLRYHLQYRDERGKPLRLIVEFLRAFYSRERLLDELERAQPESALERHLLGALHSEGQRGLSLSASDGPRSLIAGLRLWMDDPTTGLEEVAMSLEAVICHTLDEPSDRKAPPAVRDIVARALQAIPPEGNPAARIQAGLAELRRYGWSHSAADAIDLIELLCVEVDDDPLSRLMATDAVNSRRTSLAAREIRGVVAQMLARAGCADDALDAAADLLDDTTDLAEVTEIDRGWWWLLWLSVVPKVADPTRRPQVGQEVTGSAWAVNIRRGTNVPADIHPVMAALTPASRSLVATSMAVGTLDIDVPAEDDPLQFIDHEAQDPIKRLVIEHRSPTTKSAPGQ